MAIWRTSVLLGGEELDFNVGCLVLAEAEPVPAKVDLDRVAKGGDFDDLEDRTLGETHLKEPIDPFGTTVQATYASAHP
jgi:hypothetical protein